MRLFEGGAVSGGPCEAPRTATAHRASALQSQVITMRVILLFMLGLGLIMLCGNRLVDAAVDLAKKCKIPEAIIGAAVVSIATTLPEILVSATAAVREAPDLAAGSATGSIICNTALIAGFSLLARPSRDLEPKPYLWRLMFFAAADVFLTVCGLMFGGFPRWAGAVLIAGFAAYTVLCVRKDPIPPQEMGPAGHVARALVMFVVCTAGLAFGARLLVDNGVRLAEAAHLPQRVIAVTFIALGTSLPELVTAVSAVMKGHSDLSLGNILGANTLNLLLVAGIPAVIRPLSVDPLTARLDLPLGLGLMLVLTVPMMIRKKGSRLQGFLLVCAYVIYALLQF